MFDKLNQMFPLFPVSTDTPVQHLVALRLALIERSKEHKPGSAEFMTLSSAINKVTEQIRNMGYDPSTAARASQDVVKFYRTFVAMHLLFKALDL